MFALFSPVRLPGLTTCFYKRHPDSLIGWLAPLISPTLFEPGCKCPTDSLTDLLIAGSNQPPIISRCLPVSSFTGTWHFKCQWCGSRIDWESPADVSVSDRPVGCLRIAAWQPRCRSLLGWLFIKIFKGWGGYVGMQMTPDDVTRVVPGCG